MLFIANVINDIHPTPSHSINHAPPSLHFTKLASRKLFPVGRILPKILECGYPNSSGNVVSGKRQFQKEKEKHKRRYASRIGELNNIFLFFQPKDLIGSEI